MTRMQMFYDLQISDMTKLAFVATVLFTEASVFTNRSVMAQEGMLPQ